MNKDNTAVRKFYPAHKNTFKILLSALFAFFVSPAYAAPAAGTTTASLGDACSLTDKGPCYYLLYDKTGPNGGTGSVTIQTIISKKATIAFSGEAYIESLIVNKDGIDLNGRFSGGSGIKQGSFKNAALTGSYIAREGAPAIVDNKMDFDGSYNGGYAFGGTLQNLNGSSIWTFINDANATGTLQAGALGSDYGINNITFTNSSMDGIIKNQNDTSTGNVAATISQRVSSTITFTGNSSKGFAFSGTIENSVGSMDVSFSNDAKMIGGAQLSEDGKTSPTKANSTTLSFTNSSLTGDISTSGTGKRKITFSGNQSTDNYAMKGNATNNGGTLNITLDGGAIWQGDENNKAIDNSGTTTLTLKSSSSISGDITNNDKGSLNITLEGSNHSGNFNLAGGSATITASGKSTLGDFNGAGMLTLSLDGSSAGNIANSNTSSSIEFKDTLSPPHRFS